MEGNHTVFMDVSDHSNFSVETQFLLLAKGHIEYKIGKIFIDILQSHSCYLSIITDALPPIHVLSLFGIQHT